MGHDDSHDLAIGSPDEMVSASRLREEIENPWVRSRQVGCLQSRLVGMMPRS